MSTAKAKVPPGVETAMEKHWRDRYDRLLFLARQVVDCQPRSLEFLVRVGALRDWIYPPRPQS